MEIMLSYRNTSSVGHTKAKLKYQMTVEHQKKKYQMTVEVGVKLQIRIYLKPNHVLHVKKSTSPRYEQVWKLGLWAIIMG